MSDSPSSNQPTTEAYEQLQRSNAKLRATIVEMKAELGAHKARIFPSRMLSSVLGAEAEDYRVASPFPHIAIDGLIETDMLRRVAAECEQMDGSIWDSTQKPLERKLANEDSTTFGPHTLRLFATLNGSKFVTFLEKLTGIRGLIADAHLRGGGIHEIRRGGLLGVHADFNLYKRVGIWRRLNVLIYINERWEPSWGGNLELWDREGQGCVKSIAPAFNRTVVFETSNFSYHGHPHPMTCPEGEARRSLALYYYTVDYPYTDDRTPHSTLFLGAGDVPPDEADEPAEID